MKIINSKQLKLIIRYGVPFVLVPALCFLGASVLDAKKHLLVSLGVALFSLLLFYAGFEKRGMESRRLVVAAVMVALCVLGRFIPFFKPITAITIITAMYLGGETGFLVGSMSALISNFYFGQGPWTAFQMLSWGLIGFVAGVWGRRMRESRALLLTFGVLSGIAYSFIMDIWTVLWYAEGFDAKLYLAAIVTAVPYTLSYAISNFVFLWFLAEPFGRKLLRLKIKYRV